jgi:uncharacterized protein YjbI with pentapeptide repeats
MAKSSLKEKLEKNNWNENGRIFHMFNSQEELDLYLNRDSNHPDWREEYGRFDFEQCTFNFELHFYNREFNEVVFFKNSTFNESVNFHYCKFHKNADFDGCNFKDLVNFRGAKFNEEFYIPTNFKGVVDFSYATFNSHMVFFHTFFNKDLKLNNAKFMEGADFRSTVFNEKFIFHDTEVFKNITFQDSDFNGKVDSWNLTCYGDLNFKWTNFRNKVNLSETKVENGSTNFQGANFEKNAYFYDSIFSDLDLTHSVIDKGIFFLNSKIHYAKRETWRIIKHEFVKSNNRIESIQYHSLELNELEKELFDSDNYKKYFVIRFFGDLISIIKNKNNRTDKFILFSNRISNEYNMKPFKGILFTFTSAIILYILLIYSIKLETGIILNYSFEYLSFNFKQILELMNITNWNYHPIEVNFNWSYGVIFLSRVIIGFGLYQTIQAFRRFGKI